MSAYVEPTPSASPSTGRRPARVRALRRVVRRPAGAIGTVLVAVVVGPALLASRIAPGDPFAIDNPALQPPSRSHLFGTDNLGRDLFRAVVHGTRTSMTVVLWVTAISALIGISVGAVAGYSGGIVDRMLMRVTELFQSIPRFFLALLALSLFHRTLHNLILVLGLTSWTLLARVVRAEASSIRTCNYVEAARSYGASDIRIIGRHVIPNITSTAIAVVSLNASQVILLEASLAFLGLRDQTRMSLGFLISNAQPFLQQNWWMSVFPGVAIFVAVLGINLIADSINEILDPLVGGAAQARSLDLAQSLVVRR